MRLGAKQHKVKVISLQQRLALPKVDTEILNHSAASPSTTCRLCCNANKFAQLYTFQLRIVMHVLKQINFIEHLLRKPYVLNSFFVSWNKAAM